MVKNGQKLKKGSFFPIKTLTREMAPNDMIQETQKKNWNKWRRGGNRKKTTFFWHFSENYENSQAKNPVDGKKKSQKCVFFRHFLEISRNRIFHWEWANRREKNESSL